MHSIQFVSLRTQQSQPATVAAAGESMKEDEFKKSKMSLYQETLSFVDLFQCSRHPNTVCWLLEIIHILTNKIQPPASMLARNTSVTKHMSKLLDALI